MAEERLKIKKYKFMESQDKKKEETIAFPSIIGQWKVRKLLYRAMGNDRISHGLLFVGKNGVGRFALALEFARVLNCTEKEPLDSARYGCECKSCRQIRKLQHPNLSLLFPLIAIKKKQDEQTAADMYNELIETKAADPYNQLNFKGSQEILIYQVRELRNSMALTGEKTGVRVVIIYPANWLNKSSSNALLKLLEEPAERCCLILIAESIRSVMPTILSRCQIIQFAPLTASEITESLVERIGVSEDKAEEAARLADGSYSHAKELADVKHAQLLDESLDFLRHSAVGNAKALAQFIDEWTKSRSKQEIQSRLNYISVWIKDALLCQAFTKEDAQSRLSTIGSMDVLEKMSSRYESEKLGKVLNEIEEAKLNLNSNAVSSLVLTGLAIKIQWILQ